MPGVPFFLLMLFSAVSKEGSYERARYEEGAEAIQTIGTYHFDSLRLSFNFLAPVGT